MTLPQVTQLTGDWEKPQLEIRSAPDWCDDSPKYPGEGSPASAETTAFKKLLSSTGLPGRVCTLHSKEKRSHLGRATRQARDPLLHSMDNMAKPTALLNE